MKFSIWKDDERSSQFHRRGFTLIELLVVISIIAILAAILFPVFARAKVAAKAATSISNAKQHGLSILMYAQDYDDQFVLAGLWGSQDPDACQRYAALGAAYMPWTGLVESYAKNLEINNSPMTGRTLPFVWTTINRCSSERQCALLYPTYGYNAVLLSPSYEPESKLTSVSTTAVAKPSEQVMLTEIWSRNRTATGANAGGAFRGYITFGTAEAPGLCSVQSGIVKPRYGGCWGFGWQDNHYPQPEEGKYTGGVAFRYNLMTPTLFADGHVKKMTREKLAAGTNYRYGQVHAGDVTLNLDGKYLWNPTGEW